MKEVSTEIINIDGKDYTLYLNRKGIVAWEKYTQKEKEKLKDLQEKYKDLYFDESVVNFDELNNDANPFEGLDKIDNIDDDAQFIINIYERLYWIMLYTHHQLKIDEAKELYAKAQKEYGDEQLILLGQQMVEDVNTNQNQSEELKNLTALKPTKK